MDISHFLFLLHIFSFCPRKSFIKLLNGSNQNKLNGISFLNLILPSFAKRGKHIKMVPWNLSLCSRNARKPIPGPSCRTIGKKPTKKSKPKSTQKKRQAPCKRKSAPKSHHKCPRCSGKGVVRKKRPGRSGRGLPQNNHFPYFFQYVAKRYRESGRRECLSGSELMIRASSCWKSLTPEQKQDWIEKRRGGGGGGSSSSCDSTSSTIYYLGDAPVTPGMNQTFELDPSPLRPRLITGSFP